MSRYGPPLGTLLGLLGPKTLLGALGAPLSPLGTLLGLLGAPLGTLGALLGTLGTLIGMLNGVDWQVWLLVT